MDNVNIIIEHAEQYCKNRGTRLTIKRKQVLSLLVQSKKALSAYDVIDLYKQKFDEKLPPMSVYRILEFLENEKLVHQLKLANKYVACSHITCDHTHDIAQFLICNVCDQVKEISVNKNTMADLKSDVEHAGYKLATPQLEMNCICNTCLEKVA
jgi:Fur family zinc uptake transcriptional regulator